MSITPEELAAWRAAREKATSGEWQADVRVGCAAVYPGERRNCLDGVAADGAIAWHKGYWDEEERCWRVDDQRVTDFQFIALAANNWTRLLDEITRLRAECDRLEKRLDGHGHCGICGALLPNDMLRYGALGDDAGWVCNDCIAVSEMEDQHAGQ